MQLRISGTYWRFILIELLKLLGLTACIIVTVGAFALALKPFADGKIGAIDALYFMMYASVPMLQYALPFAAGFAATLTYHRLAQDNELTACYAGGISHRAILVPSIALGLLCSISLFLLADQAIPRLLLKTQELITRDASRIISAAVERREALTLPDSKGGRKALFAEQFTRPQGPPPAPAYDYFILTGVLAVELDAKGQVLKEASAKRADVWLYRQTEETDTGAVRGITTVVMKLSDTVGSITSKGTFDLASATQVFKIPDQLIDNPKFLSWSQMEDVRARPELMQELDRRRRELAAAVAERQIIDLLDADLREDGQAILKDSVGKVVTIRSAGTLPPDSGGYPLKPSRRNTGRRDASGADGTGDPDTANAAYVEIATTLADGSIRLQLAKSAEISRTKVASDTGQSTLDIRLKGVSTTGPMPAGPVVNGQAAESEPGNDDVAGELSEYTLTSLVPANDPLPELLKLSIAELLAQPQVQLAAAGGSITKGPLKNARDSLARETASTLRELTSKQHERLAASIACLVTIVAGAIMAIRLKDSLPLPVYLWSFLPALGALFSIAGGQSVTYRSGNAGLLLLYGGIALLLAWTLLQYRKLAAH